MIIECPYCTEEIEPDIEGTICDRCSLEGCEICMPDGLCEDCVRTLRAEYMEDEYVMLDDDDLAD